MQRGCGEEGNLDEVRRGSTAAGERSAAAAECAGVEMVMGWAVSIVGQVKVGGATRRKAVTVTIAVGALALALSLPTLAYWAWSS